MGCDEVISKAMSVSRQQLVIFYGYVKWEDWMRFIVHVTENLSMVTLLTLLQILGSWQLIVYFYKYINSYRRNSKTELMRNCYELRVEKNCILAYSC